VKCGGCRAELGHINAQGEPMMRTRGLILKAEGVVAVCPKCKADVPLSGEMRKALSARLLVVVPKETKAR
jgi:hypothetical protein